MGCEEAVGGQLCGSGRDRLPELVIEAAPVRLQVSSEVSCTTSRMLTFTYLLTFLLCFANRCFNLDVVHDLDSHSPIDFAWLRKPFDDPFVLAVFKRGVVHELVRVGWLG